MPERLQRIEAELFEHRMECRVLYAARALPPAATWQGRPMMIPGEPATGAIPYSTGCREESFQEPWFSYWTAQFHVRLLYHRKLWEYVFICQVLWERGALAPGSYGLGFGVGTEPLTPWFAAHGCSVVATDMSAAEAEAVGWSVSRQHAFDVDAMQWPAICSREVFDANVSLRECDMNAIPAELTGFDFCWSSCALEHLGSIEHGLAFIERSLECLRPGGWAVHTTEFNLTSNDQTVETGDTVLFRRRDLEELCRRLAAKGHVVAPLDMSPGFGVIDNYVDVPPYRSEPCLKIALLGYATTSFGLIIQRGPIQPRLG